MYGTNTNLVTIVGIPGQLPPILQLKATLNGGFLYLRGNIQTVVLTNIGLVTTESGGHGGFIYSEVTSTVPAPTISITVNYINPDPTLKLVLQTLKATGKGSFLYISGTNSPVATINLSNIMFHCQSWDYCVDVLKFDKVYQSLFDPLTTVKKIGGLFYFDIGVTGQIISSNNEFSQCHTTTEGSIFYLTSGIQLIDTKSFFYGNAGTKGTIYCLDCWMKQTEPQYKCMIAETASFMYISSHATAPSPTFVDITNGTIEHGRSIKSAGGIYADGDGSAFLNLNNCGLIQYFETLGDGGFFYIANAGIQLSKLGTNFNNLFSPNTSFGDYIEGYIYPDGTNLVVHSSFSVGCRLGNITSVRGKNEPAYSGGATGTTVKDCEIDCGYKDVLTVSAQRSNLAATGTKQSIYLLNGQVMNSVNNKIQYCIAKQGAIFSLVNSEFTDKDSIFTSNGANNGGVFFCNWCKITLTNTTFIDNYAEYGGIFYVVQYGQIILQDVNIIGSRAMNQGGIAYVNGLQSDMELMKTDGAYVRDAVGVNTYIKYAEITITQTIATPTTPKITKLESLQDAAGIYIANGVIKVNNIAIDLVTAQKNGGFIYSDGTIQVTMTNTVISNMAADKGGFMYADSALFVAPAPTQPSFLRFEVLTTINSMQATTAGGMFYVNNPYMTINMDTPITLNKASVLSGSGGVFYIQDISTIVFTQQTPGDQGIYQDLKVPHPNYGSFLYSIAKKKTFTIQDVVIQCQMTPPVASSLDSYMRLITQQPLYGGAIYMKDATSVISTNNQYRYCYYTNFGGIYYLTTDPAETVQANYIQFYEQGTSTYEFNQADRGGVIYCEKCMLNIKPNAGKVITIQDNWAKQGGVIYIQEVYNGVLDKVKILRSTSTENGGVISFINTNNQLGIMDIMNCFISQSQSTIGGSFYFQTKQIQKLTITNTIIDGSTSTENGGIIFVQEMPGEILINGASQLQNFKVSPIKKGSLFYSAIETNILLTIKQSFIKCDTTAVWADALAALAANPLISTQAGAIYMENSIKGVISDFNTFLQCQTSQDGGIFYIVESQVQDTFSNYQKIQALYGSVMKCRNCQFSFIDSNMDGAQAESGGAFMVENNGIGYVQRTSFVGTQATNQGGVLSVVQSGLVNLNINTIQFVDCLHLTANQAYQGGIFYINQPKIIVKILNSVVKDARATDTASVAMINSGQGFIIENSKIINIFAPKSQVLYSSSVQLKLQILNSIITCNSSYNPLSVIELFREQDVPFNSTNSFFISGDQQTLIESSNNLYEKCSMLEDGGVFRIEGRTNFQDSKSIYTYNSATEGGVFSCSLCNITLQGTQMKTNQAKRGGVVKLEAQGNFTSIKSFFLFNLAQEIGGVIFVTTQSTFNMIDSEFNSNEANQSSTIDVLGASSYIANRITGCYFYNNTAVKNTISLKESKVYIAFTKFKNNLSQERSKNLFVAFSEVNITDCAFESPEYAYPQRELRRDQTMGAFIFIILDVNIRIINTKFTHGLAKYGGAIFVSGQSDITLINCQIENCMADIYGGALFANGFRHIKIQGGSKFLENTANLKGDDFYLSNTEEAFEMDDVLVSNSQAKNSLYAEQVTLLIKSVKYQNAMFNPKSEKGAAILCFGCRRVDISYSIFKYLKSQQGAALHLTDIPTNKKDTDGVSKYRISNTFFEYITGNVGGVLYLDHPQSFQIINSTFYQSKALNMSQDQASQQSGIGGSIYYLCSAIDPACNLEILGTTTFQYNYASQKGGAIHYTYYEPKFGRNVSFITNKAGWYGDSVSSYSTQLKSVANSSYQSQLKKINEPMTYPEFYKIVQKSLSKQRILQNSTLDKKLDLFTTQERASYHVPEFRSGGDLPVFWLAHVDKYGQIVSDFDSKIRVAVDQQYTKNDNNTKAYKASPDGPQQFISYGGVSQLSNLSFTGAPGYKYRLTYLSNGIDEKLPVNIEFKKHFDISAIEFDFLVDLRNCSRGEKFTNLGKCIWCDASMGYSLVNMTEPGDCRACPNDKALCTGGYNIGPDQGYWRSSEYSINFLRCPNPKACRGWLPPPSNLSDPKGNCTEGQTGTLCAECLPGYSLSGLAKCGKCPDLTSNVLKMVGISILVIGIFTFMVRSTLAGATQQKNNTSIYLKILMNHFQLILLVSSFNFQWPKQVEVFFSASSPVSEASTQVVSVDCFVAAKASSFTQKGNFFRTYYLKLIIFALIPFLLGLISYLFWWIQKCLRKTEFQKGKAIATLVISLFTIHPNIVQIMFNNYNCMDIDSHLFVYTDMGIQCWDKPHTFWSNFVVAPSIVVWGLGIPFFALVLMYRERHQLERVETKEKFGFLYGGYTQALFFWEIVIMYRKIGMIFISVFISTQGTIAQALIVLLVLIVFLIANLKKKPYLAVSLNDLETISLVTSTLSIYCGIFFLTDVPTVDVYKLPTTVKGNLTLTETTRTLLFLLIMVSNLTFFGYWLYKMMQEIKNTLLKKAEKIYLMLFLCGDRNKLEREKQRLKLEEENENLREKYFKSVGNLKQLYKDGRLILTQKTLERAQVYLEEERYLEALGFGKREINEKELKRYNRLTQGAEIKHNEREKNMYSEAFKKNMKKKNLNEDMLFEENDEKDNKKVLFDADQSPSKQPGNIVAIRPGSSPETIISGEGYTGETEQQLTTQQAQQTATNKLLKEEYGENGPTFQFGNLQDPDKLLSKDLKSKNNKKQTLKPHKRIDSSSFDKDSEFEETKNHKKNKIWEDIDDEIQDVKKKSQKSQQNPVVGPVDQPETLTKEEEEKLQRELDIKKHIKKGNIRVETQTAKNQETDFKKTVQQKPKPAFQTQSTQPQKLLERANPKKPHKVIRVDEEDKIEKELNFDGSISEEEVPKAKKKEKKKPQNNEDEEIEVFSDNENEIGQYERFKKGLNKNY